MTDEEYQDALNAANDWRYLMTLGSEGMTKDQLWKHNKNTTKGDLDIWLMSRYGFDHSTARTISNYSMDNIDYKIDRDSIRWIAKRPCPTWEQYPDLTAIIKVRKSE